MMLKSIHFLNREDSEGPYVIPKFTKYVNYLMKYQNSLFFWLILNDFSKISNKKLSNTI